MCENENNCPATNYEVVNQCEGTTVISTPTEDNTKIYIDGLLDDIKKLQADLKNATENQNRFQELYQICLAAIYVCLQNDSIDTLKEVITKLGEIEAEYCKA